MSFLNRKVLAVLGATAAAVASTAVMASPAQAASAGLASVSGTTVGFRALMGKANGLSITIKGRTVTLDDKVAIKAGKGCKAVKGDKTKVKCTTKKATKTLRIALGDKNDWVTNKTKVYMLADGGTGNDKLTGGSGKDQLQGASGNDQLFGRTGNDILIGGTGADRIDGGAGNDEIDGNSGNDSIWGGPGNDAVVGQAGNDRIVLGSGDDVALGDSGNDHIWGDAGNDVLFGETVDTITLEPKGSNAALDKVNGGANWAAGDICHVFAKGTTTGCETVLNASAAAAAKGADVSEALARVAAVRN